MTNRKLLTALALNLAALGAAVAPAQTLKLKSSPISDRIIFPENGTLEIDLKEHFDFDGVTGQLVQFITEEGTFNIEMLAQDAPKTVARFLEYVDAGDYDGMIVHRSVPGFIVQSGAYNADEGGYGPLVSRGTIQNEYKVSNTRGTLAMAKKPEDANSATSEWFVNLADNSQNLNNQNGGFTVFARVIGTGMTVPDKIASRHVADLRFYGYPFAEIPLDITGANAYEQLILIKTTRRLAKYPTAGAATAAMSFTTTSSDNLGANPTLSGSKLVLALNHAALGDGPVTITVTAKDTNNNSVNLAFKVAASFAKIALPAKSVDASAGSYSFAIDANVAWTSSSAADWVTVSPASGTGDGTVTLSYASNPGLFPREGQATIGDDTHVISQAAAKFGPSSQTFREWLDARFDDDEADERYEDAATYDGDGDGLPIGFEFALGLDDEDPKSTISQRMASEDGALYLVVAPRSPAVAVELLASADLSAPRAEWDVVAGAPQEARGDELWIRIEDEDSSFYSARLSLVGAE